MLDEESVAYGLAFIVSVWTWFKNNYVTAKGRQQKEVLVEQGLTKGDK
ncbi:phage holin [Alkalihalobacillus trypoxylicola]|nr:phage holin [Alkalihalobacillus trypoxylicola]